jgi:hypothetical protein
MFFGDTVELILYGIMNLVPIDDAFEIGRKHSKEKP